MVELESEGKASRPKKNPAREMLLESEAEACRPKKNLAWERSSEMLRQYPQVRPSQRVLVRARKQFLDVLIVRFLGL